MTTTTKECSRSRSRRARSPTRRSRHRARPEGDLRREPVTSDASHDLTDALLRVGATVGVLRKTDRPRDFKVVALEAAGSNPVIHPTLNNRLKSADVFNYRGLNSFGVAPGLHGPRASRSPSKFAGSR